MKVEVVDGQFGVLFLGEDELRPCGACQACCSIMAVPDLNKPSYSACPHQCLTGCNIYGQHPETCQSFICLWKLPGYLLAEEDRPDKLGVILCVRTIEEKKQLEVWELWHGAARQPRVRELLSRVTVDYVIVTQLTWTIQV